MVEYSSNKFIIVTQAVLVIYILSSIGSMINGRMISWAGVLSVVILYGIMKKKDWINEGIRVFGAFVMYSAIIQVRYIIKQPFDYIVAGIIICQLAVFVYGFISLFFASKYIKTVDSGNVAT